MKILAKTKKVLLSLTVLTALLSCSKDTFYDEEGGGGTTNGKDTEVSIVVSVPDGAIPTRALGEGTNDAEVDEVVVMQFTTGYTGEDAGKNELKFVTKSTTKPIQEGNKLTFSVKLLTGNYNIVVLANSGGIYEAVRDANGGDLRKRSYDELQKLFTKAVKGNNGDGDKWNTTVNAQKDYLIPLWGIKNNVPISHETTNQIVQTVYLFRMLAKVDVTVQRLPGEGYDGVSLQDFRMAYVSFHNYNRTGLVMPELGNGNWETDHKATKPSLLSSEDKVTGYDHCQAWTTMTEENNALKGEIFTFEASKGIDYTDRACVIIGGYYNWNGDEATKPAMCYYRIDMQNLSGSYFDMMRNYKYNVIVRKVKGAGYPDVETAYKSKPTNITAEVIPWNDGEYTEGIWEGANEISFTSRTAHFTQFGMPEDQIFKVRTTADELIFDKFWGQLVGADSEHEWQENPVGSGRWSNGHFSVEISDPTTSGQYTEYQFKVSAKPTVLGNPARKSYFTVHALNLDAVFTITQDAHVTYRLITNPDPMIPMMLDGVKQRIHINVSSTHNYSVTTNHDSGNMCTGYVYSDPTGSTTLNKEDIPKDVKDIYVEVGDYTGIRAGRFSIQHVEPLSDVSPSIYNVIQTTPVINAFLADGGYTAEVSRTASQKAIKVTSNMAAWKPVLKIKVDNVSTEITGSALGNYFNKIQGANNEDITFNIPAMSDTEMEDKTFIITFKDISGDTESKPAIEITQIAKKPGTGSGGQQPGSGVDAIPGLLAVNSEGQLNLNGEGHLVYFKFGSLIAIWSGKDGDVFDVTDVAWAPEGYDYNKLITDIGKKKGQDAWGYIPYAGTAYSGMTATPGSGWNSDYKGNPDYPSDARPEFTSYNLLRGLGDPCKHAYSKDGKKYKTPKGIDRTVSEQIIYDMPTTYPAMDFGILGSWYNKGRPDAQFYPIGGLRYSSSGYVDRTTTSHFSYFGGYFWAAGTETPGSLATNRGAAMRVTYSGSTLLTLYRRDQGHLIRCVEDE